jgi:O-antigen/teichoic acid export membrane protein
VGIGALHVLLVPKLLPLNAFGLYRVFVLYAAYVGVLHLGVADGALLRWAGRDPRSIAAEWRRVAGWMWLAQGMVALVFLLVGLSLAASDARSIVIGLGCAALVVNVSTVTGFALQAARDFRWAGLAVAMQPALFLLGLVILPSPARSIGAAVSLWLLSHLITCALITIRMLRIPVDRVRESTWPTPAALLRVGIVAMLANSAAGLLQSIDRVILSAVIPVSEFAIYGFAASALFIAQAAPQVLSRVALPYSMRLDRPGRSALFSHMHDLILTGYGVGLLAYPAFEMFVSHWLPTYSSALPVTRALVVGTLFWAAGQSVQSTAFRASGRLMTQLYVTLAGAVTVALTTAVAFAVDASLPWIGTSASVGMALAWTVGSVALRKADLASAGGDLRFAALGCVQSGALILAMGVADTLLTQTLLYGVVAATPTWVAIKSVLARSTSGSPALSTTVP